MTVTTVDEFANLMAESRKETFVPSLDLEARRAAKSTGDNDPLAALSGYLAVSNEQIAAIEQIMVDAFNALIKEATATRDMLANTLSHNRNINAAAVDVVRDAGAALNTLSTQHQELARKFREVVNGKG